MIIPINIPDSLFAFTGAVQAALRSSVPEGWLLLNGLTIGNASSGASGRASNDTEALFLTLWNDTEAVVIGERGDSAAADYAANKELVLPDFAGLTLAGRDAVGSVLAGAEVLGATLGSQAHALSLSEIPNHQHSLNNSGTFDTGGPTTSNAVGSDVSGSASDVNPAVMGTPHNNVQPTVVVNWMIKL